MSQRGGGKGQGRGQGGQGRGQGGQGRGQGGQGRGGQGRGQDGQGRGGGQGRGDGQGRGGQGRGQGGQQQRGRGGGAPGQQPSGPPVQQVHSASAFPPLAAAAPPPQGAWGQPRAQTPVQPPPGFSAPQVRPQSPQQQQQHPMYPPQQQQQRPMHPPQQQQQRPMHPPQQQPPRQPPPQQQHPQQQRQQQQPPRQQHQQQPGGDVSSKLSAMSISKPVVAGGDALKEREIIAKGGTAGRKTEVFTNHFAMKFRNIKSQLVYQYDVTIDPDRPKKMMRPVMEEFKRIHYPRMNPAYDGSKSLYAAQRLPFGDYIEDTISIVLDERAKEYKVKIKEVQEIDMSALVRFYDQVGSGVITDAPQVCLQVVDVVLRHTLSLRQIVVGSSLFHVPTTDRTIDLGGGMHLYRGMYQSAILGWRPFLNVDVSNKAFPSASNIIDLIREFGGRDAQVQRKLDNWMYEKLRKHLRTLRVQYEIPRTPTSRRNYRVNGVESTSVEHVFEHEGRQVDVATYYASTKGYRIQYPNMPLLWVGSMQNRVLVPCELCTVLPGQAVNRKCDANQTRNMIRECATHTDVRKNGIASNVQAARYNEDPVAQEFGFGVNSEMMKVEARILTPPKLVYKNNTVAPVARGVWMPREFMVSGVITTGWTVLKLDRYVSPQDMNRLVELAQTCGRQLGMNMGGYQPNNNRELRRGRELEDLKDVFADFKKRKLDLVFVILPGNNDRMYSFVKHAAEIAVGCLTQCLKSQTLQKRMNDMTMKNILLKVNAKLAGSNHLFQTVPQVMKNNYVMLMGADVTHPSPDVRDGFSVAAVTASHCPGAFGYNICWRLQRPGQEIILDMEEITSKHLLRFYQKNKQMKPEKIIVFRDGVSTGQFEAVLQAEMQAIRRACKKMAAGGANYEPAITFIVVQKRHHTRFFPVDKRISEDKNCNVPAGTIVDKTITHPTRQDFYLVSHASIQGVAKPTKYVTLWDDSEISDNDLEELTYYLCHMFSRCTRSVSYPAPTYYAHLAAARGKAYCDARGTINTNNLEQEQRMLQIKDCIVENLPMFFV